MKAMQDGVLGEAMWEWEKQAVAEIEAKIVDLEDELLVLKAKRAQWYRKVQARARRRSGY